MTLTKSVFVALAVSLIGSSAFAADELRTKKKAVAIVALTDEKQISAYELGEKHKALVEEAKSVLSEIQDGTLLPDSDEVVALEAKVRAAVEADKLEPIGTRANPNSELAQSSDKGTKAGWWCRRGWGWGGGWGWGWGGGWAWGGWRWGWGGGWCGCGWWW